MMTLDIVIIALVLSLFFLRAAQDDIAAQLAEEQAKREADATQPAAPAAT
jgi:hypothetical protein